MFSKYKNEIITLGVIGLIVAAGGWFIFTNNAQVTKDQSAAGQSLFASELAHYTDMAGNPVTLEEYYGSVLVVNSWATWCPFCVNELPDFEALAQEFADEEVVVIAINRKETKEQAQKFLDRLNDFSAIEFLLDPNDYYYRSIGGFAMPETVFYDETGAVVVHKRGFMKLDEMRTHLQAALAGADQ